MNPKKIHSFLEGKTPFLYLISEEEERVERMVSAAAQKVRPAPLAVYYWTCVAGLSGGSDGPATTTDPVSALERFQELDERAVLVFKDLHLLLQGNPRLSRKLKDIARALRKSPKRVVFICPELALPSELYSIFRIEDVPLPSNDELTRILDSCIDSKNNAASLKASLDEDTREKLVRAAMGFTFNEAIDAFDGALTGEREITGKTVDAVLAEKQRLVRKSGVLEYIDVSGDIWQIGGLMNLKKWCAERDKAFSPEAAKLGMSPPKGILVMGVSGCGKSLCIKAIASLWKLPLLRLDMGRLYDGLAGEPEEAMRKAIKTSEAVAPCILWIDEIEAGIANQKQKQSGGKEARVLAVFLTWLQEKTAPVFVGATANEVEALPPEILRKGRFDELFYMGLPSPEERKQILSIHLQRRHKDPARFDLDYLAGSTEGLNGAEIEQGVIASIYEAVSQKQELSEHILANSLRNIVPLSRTMRERIQKIEAWARDRAMKASLETIT